MKILLTLNLVCIFLFANAQKFHVNEDFNQATLPSGWTNTALNGTQNWNFGLDGATVHINNQNLDGTSFAYFDDDAYGSSSNNNHVELITPTFNNHNNTLTFLEFDYNFRSYSTIPDTFFVEVFDGSQWQVVFSKTTDDCGSYTSNNCRNNFPHAKINISTYKNANCKVRFRYYDGHNSNDWGWYVGIDNVQIYSPFNNDLSVKRIISLESNCGLSNTEMVEVVIQNKGADTTTSFPLAFAVNGIEIANETVNASLAYKDTLIYQFNTTANLSIVGQYQVSAYPKLTSDSNIYNDTAIVSIQNNPFYTLPYSNDFETSIQDWTVSGTNASWQKGVPNSIIIDTAFSGIQAWVTNLNGNYNNNEFSYLTSPCFDFSTLIYDPLISFYLNYETELYYDFSWMEYSIDNGLSWFKVMANSLANNWYNNKLLDVWEGNSNGWIKVENILTGFAGEPSFKLRMVLKSDNNILRQGVGFDNFKIKELDSINLGIESSLSPVLSNNPNCTIGNGTNIVVNVKNFGKDDTLNFNFNYQVNGGTIFSSNHNMIINRFEEALIVADSTYDFDPNLNYQFKCWLSVNGDVDLSNDTLSGTIQNTSASLSSNSIPIYEDFTRSIPGRGSSNFGSQLISNWINYGSTASNGVGWRISNGTYHSSVTAPLSGMYGKNGNFAYLEASYVSNVGTKIYLESPCLALQNDTNLKLTFGYHKYGLNMGDLFIEVSRNNDQWQAIDSIKGQTHSLHTAPWLKRIISLKDYSGQSIKIRFVGVSAGCCAGDMAIDNILISDTNWVDLSIESLESQSGCYLSNQEQVIVKVNNFSDSIIPPNSVTMHYQIDNQAVVSELIPDTIKKDSSYLFRFSQTADLSQFNRKYDFLIYHTFNQDMSHINDSLLSEVQNNTGLINHTEEFEQNMAYCQSHSSSYNIFPNGWKSRSWYVQNDTACRFNTSCGATESDSTGPAFAKSGHGFAYFESSGSGNGGLETTCFDFTNQSQLILEFYYHKYGRNMDNLIIQVIDSVGNRISVDSIIGQTHFSNTDPWLKKTVNLNQFSNQKFKLSFYASRTTGYYTSDIAIDDVRIFNPLTVSNLDFEKRANEFTLYPNPSKGRYTIQSEKRLSGLKYQVYNFKGQLIQEGILKNHNNQIDLSNSPAGIYFFQINELGIREKLIKY